MMVGKPDTNSAHEFQSVWSVSGERLTALRQCRGVINTARSMPESSGACRRGEERPELRVKGRMLICEALKASSRERHLL